MWVQSLGGEDPLEEGTAIHSSILAWRTPWTEECGGLQSTGSQFPFTLKPPTILPGTLLEFPWKKIFLLTPSDSIHRAMMTYFFSFSDSWVLTLMYLNTLMPVEKGEELIQTISPLYLCLHTIWGFSFRVDAFFWPCPAMCYILVTQLKIEPAPQRLKAQSRNHWTPEKSPE